MRIGPVSIAALLRRMSYHVFFVAVGTSVAQAACSQWDMGGRWSFVQTNGPTATFTLQQTDTGLQGYANYSFLTKDPCFLVACGDDYHQVGGSVDGSINGNSIEINAYWSNGTIGVYTGTIGPQGRIQGTTFDRMHPQTIASWYSGTTAKCIISAGEVAPSPKAPKAPITLPLGSSTMPAGGHSFPVK